MTFMIFVRFMSSYDLFPIFVPNPLKQAIFNTMNMKIIPLILLTLAWAGSAWAQQPIQDGTGRNFTMVTTREASYPGGNVAMAKYIYRNMMYPEAAKANKIQGDIMVVFFVEPDSTASEVKAMKDLGHGTKEEAERLIRAAKFLPALQNGKPIRQQMMVSVPFRIYD